MKLVQIAVRRADLDEAVKDWVFKHTGLKAAAETSVFYEEDICEKADDELAVSLDVEVPAHTGGASNG